MRLKHNLEVLGFCLKVILCAVVISASGVLLLTGNLRLSCLVWLQGSYCGAVIYFVGFCVLVFAIHPREFFDGNDPTDAGPLGFVYGIVVTLLLVAGITIAITLKGAPWVVVPSFLMTSALVIFDWAVMSPRVSVKPSRQWQAVIRDAIRLDIVLLFAFAITIVYTVIAKHLARNVAPDAIGSLDIFAGGASAFGMFVSTLYFIIGVRAAQPDQASLPNATMSAAHTRPKPSAEAGATAD